MDDSSLDELIATIRSEERSFDDESISRDQPLTEQRIRDIESQFQLTLPHQYRRFLLKYGAGDFLYSHVFSCDPDSGWSLWKESEYLAGVGKSILPFSDNGCGDYYVFRIVEGKCDDRVYWADHECDYAVSDSDYVDLNTFIAQVALQS